MFIISVLTEEILDYTVKSVICPECTAHKKWDKQSNEYLKWKLRHNSVCEINHDGSSGGMEAQPAVEMFTDSIKKRKLRYTVFVGGDSSCFGTVKESLNDKYNIEKEECVGHVQKRMGSSLKNFKNDHNGKKLADGKPVEGKGCLTERVINSMQNYYGLAIRENKGNLQGMKDGIWAIYYHMIKSDDNTPLEEQHKFCPKDKQTWCKFWHDKLFASKNDKKTYDESKCLPPVFRNELKNVFKRLSDDNQLSRCLRGLTHNQNEAINCQLWQRCPKTHFCGKRRVVLAVCETVCVFNTGAGSTALLIKNCGVQPGINMIKSLKKTRNFAFIKCCKKN